MIRVVGVGVIGGDIGWCTCTIPASTILGGATVRFGNGQNAQNNDTEKVEPPY